MDRLTALADGLPSLPKRLLIGLSGGADSVALFRLMLMRREEDARLWAVHVNHGLRGADSDGDERFVRLLCDQFHVPLLVYRAIPPEHPGEGWAREARYGFFRQAMAACGAEALALAHHRDDQAETLLLHLMRGAGLTGLSGMAEDGETMNIRVVRPLMNVSRQALREALVEAGQPWREDDSNRDVRYLRNALRQELLPLMERLSPGCTGRMASAASLLREEESTLRNMASEFLALHGGEDYLPANRLCSLPVSLRRRVLRLWWERFAGHAMDERCLSRAQTEALEALADAPNGSRCNLPGGCHGYRGWTHLHLVCDTRSKPVEAVRCGEALFGIELVTSSAESGPGDGRRCQAVPPALLQDCVVRCRRQGDWIRPFGQRGRQSMQDYFVNRKVDAPFRGRIPLLCRGSEVLLAAGIGAGDIPPMEHTQETVWLSWQGEMPWMRAE